MDRLKSRKFWFALLGAVLPVVAQAMTEEIATAEALQVSAAIIISYILGQGYVDANQAAMFESFSTTTKAKKK
tara:strand:- start:623 stop:841 length:219 start_codon:yes stop_codon:yes gene_type:complete